VILNKADIGEEVKQKSAAAREIADDIAVLTVSAATGKGMRKLKKLIRRGQTYAFIGSSGVGKSTLINRIVGEEIQKTQEVRNKDSKGRHTTTRRELIVVPDGGCMIDTPGIRELQLWHADEGMAETFPDIEELAEQCHFSDCSHTKEIKCAVLNALEEGDLSRERYNSYMKIQRELEFLETKHSKSGYIEQRRKQREQGKLYKRILENKKRRKGFDSD